VGRRLRAHVERHAAPAVGLIHELGDRAGFTRQEPAADERHAGVVQHRRLYFHAEALRKPGHEVLFLVGADLDRMAHFR
jgi:hypothetical protein